MILLRKKRKQAQFCFRWAARVYAPAAPAALSFQCYVVAPAAPSLLRCPQMPRQAPVRAKSLVSPYGSEGFGTALPICLVSRRMEWGRACDN